MSLGNEVDDLVRRRGSSGGNSQEDGEQDHRLHCPVTFPPLLNMKSMILFAVFLAVAAAAPAPQESQPILILKQSQNHDTEKQVYSFSYEGENGIIVSESGVQKQIGDKPEESGTVSQGKYSFPEG